MIDRKTLEAVEARLTEAVQDLWPLLVVAMGAAPAEDPAATTLKAILAARRRADAQTRRLFDLVEEMSAVRFDLDEALNG